MTQQQAKKWQESIAKLDTYEIDTEAQYTIAQYAEMMGICESTIANLCVGWTKQELIDRVNTEISTIKTTKKEKK